MRSPRPPPSHRRSRRVRFSSLPLPPRLSRHWHQRPTLVEEISSEDPKDPKDPKNRRVQGTSRLDSNVYSDVTKKTYRDPSCLRFTFSCSHVFSPSGFFPVRYDLPFSKAHLRVLVGPELSQNSAPSVVTLRRAR